MPGKVHKTIGVGELLWDMFPAGKQLGGAPANFAYMTGLLGDEGIAASRVGCDALGNEAVNRLHELGFSAEFVQRDPFHNTGTVNVTLDRCGQPQFDISQRVAWDYLEWTAEWQRLAAQADAVCFGTLAQRSRNSRQTICNFLRAARPDVVRIFDINLRQNCYTAEIIAESLQLANVFKMNHEELAVVMPLLGLEKRSERESARGLLSRYGLELICVTRGGSGSLLVSRAEESEHPGFKVEIVDTVGAGDAFTAALAHGLLRNEPLSKINELANRVGAWVASQPGAMPLPPKGGLLPKLKEIAATS
jgi:fructokinase